MESWLETRVRKLIYGLVAPQVDSSTLVEQVGIKPYSRNDTIHMLLEMEYFHPLLSNL
jgi:hypothetical protein